MKNKTSLTLMEQVVMVLVFSLAAAICLQAFALSGQISRTEESRERAVLLCQNAAELLKHHGGSEENALEKTADTLGGTYEDGLLRLQLKEDSLLLLARPEETGIPGLCRASLQVLQGEAELFSLTVAWQEVTVDG